MNITKSIDKIKGLLEQLKDAADKTEVVYPKGTPESILTLQQKNIAKAASISEQILDEAEALTLFFNTKVGVAPEDKPIVIMADENGEAVITIDGTTVPQTEQQNETEN